MQKELKMSELTEVEKITNYETMKHINRVRDLLDYCCMELMFRGQNHDQSKLCDPELSIFTEYTNKLKNMTYGSEEYKQCLAEMKPAIDHHYANNTHHPEHYNNGIDGMSLLDLIEMIVDWKAASERHSNGDIRRSLEVNVKRFNISPQLENILSNTIKELYE